MKLIRTFSVAMLAVTMATGAIAQSNLPKDVIDALDRAKTGVAERQTRPTSNRPSRQAEEEPERRTQRYQQPPMFLINGSYFEVDEDLYLYRILPGGYTAQDPEGQIVEQLSSTLFIAENLAGQRFRAIRVR